MRRRRLYWEPPPQKLPKRPYRDTVLLYGAMALVVVLIAVATGGGLVRALIIAGAVFVAATLWSWRSVRLRLREEERRQP